jgi:hypothetical protein
MNTKRRQPSMKNYRAIISVPIQAADDDAAYRQAAKHAHSLRHPGSVVVAGHLESLAECSPGQLRAQRKVMLDPHLKRQIPESLA